jgi:hypothetical protein
MREDINLITISITNVAVTTPATAEWTHKKRNFFIHPTGTF